MTGRLGRPGTRATFTGNIVGHYVIGLPLVLSDRSGEREYFGAMASYCDPARVEDIRAHVLRAWESASAGDRDDARGTGAPAR